MTEKTSTENFEEAIKNGTHTLFKDACVGITQDDRMVYDFDKVVEIVCELGYERPLAIKIIEIIFDPKTINFEGSPVILHTLRE